MFLTWFALATLAATVAMAVEALRGMILLQRLDRIAPDTAVSLPRVSIVVAARNEAKNIHAGVSSLLKLDYPALEVIVVNDRSTDDTGPILMTLACEQSRLQLVTVNALPAGWLGKNYALEQGARIATGEYVLFTDADVIMERSVLRRALRYAHEHELDHLAIGPAALMPGVWLNLFILGFTIFFNLFTRPWAVRDPKSRAHVGIGAFNLLKRSVYEKFGRHAAIALRPDDDLKLGKLVKKNGYHSDFLIGAPLICVEWYATVGEFVRGLEKNSFAGCNYNLAMVAAGALGQIWLFQWPFVAWFFSHGIARLFYGLAALLLWSIGLVAARAQRLSGFYTLGLPVASVVFVFIFVRATWLNLRDGGITWRGTFYPLAQLRRNRV